MARRDCLAAAAVAVVIGTLGGDRRPAPAPGAVAPIIWIGHI